MPALVVNRPRASSTNGSKPLQQLIAEHGFSVPRTLVTTVPEEARRFFDECRGRVVYKSISHRRSIVRRVSADLGIEIRGDLVYEPDPQRRRSVEALARDEVATGAALSPIFRSTYGEITAGVIPSLTSENPNTARSGGRVAMSAVCDEARPPPECMPLDNGDHRRGARVGIESNIRRRALASATFAS